ncbi:MAG: thymidylate synthase [Rickettsiales bacterium]|nr:thymidylate synthase [Rickettsiales bacterium]
MSADQSFLYLAREILEKGEMRDNRTGIRTKSLFGLQTRFDARNLGMITLKKLFYKSVIEELLWFLRGETNTKTLNCKIWDANSTREFLDKRGLDYPEGEIGPSYGHQWRNSGGKIDQIMEAINLIKNDPNSRRIIVSSWIPEDIPKMALPPCHALFQFYVCNSKLSLKLHQRSADLFLGVPFNFMSYTLLLHIIATICDLEPGEIVMSYGDIHIYENHIEKMKEAISREPIENNVQLTINPELIAKYKDQPDLLFKNLTFDDFKIENYNSHPPIRAAMAI